MTDINNLIHLNLELEGLLRVLVERKSIHAKSMLADKYKEYARQLEAFLAEPDEDTAAQLEATATTLAAEATHTEVKDQEAESAEVVDETDAAVAAIERGEEKYRQADAVTIHTEVKDQEAESSEVVDETDAATTAIERGEEEFDAAEVAPVSTHPQPAMPNQKILKAFTLNDKFRFRRNLFGGDDRAFDDTLAILADMPTYDDAYDFIYNDMMLDPKNAEVADFMAVLAECYPA